MTLLKGVEIFGALTKQYPEISGVNPAELTELRTLAEIVSYVSANGKKKSNVISDIASDEQVKVEEAVSENQGQVQTGAFHGVKRFEVGLKYLPQPDFLEFSMPASHVVLVTNDGSDLTPQVISALKAKGNQVVTLNLSGVSIQSQRTP